jgi:hypothetical protein
MRFSPVLGSGRFAGNGARYFRIARCVFLLGLLLSTNFSVQVQAQDGPLPQYQVKSAFLYNFAKFIQWPPDRFERPDSPIVIGVIGNNPFGEYLEALRGKPIGTHEIVIEKVENAEQARKCHVLFVGEKGKKAANIIQKLDRAEVLTVTDEMDEFQDVGAVVNLVTSDKHVHFEINVDAAQRAQLKINSSLLNLAKIVRDGKA